MQYSSGACNCSCGLRCLRPWTDSRSLHNPRRHGIELLRSAAIVACVGAKGHCPGRLGLPLPHSVFQIQMKNSSMKASIQHVSYFSTNSWWLQQNGLSRLNDPQSQPRWNRAQVWTALMPRKKQ